MGNLKKIERVYPIVLAVLLFASIAFAGLYFTKPVVECPEINENLCSNFIVNCPEVDETLCSGFINDCFDYSQNEEKALPAIYSIVDWGANMYNEDEVLFNIHIINYGYSEAKDIEVTCKIWETDEEGSPLQEEPFFTFTDVAGNLASTSGETFSISAIGYSENSLATESYVLPVCYVSSCSGNCESLDARLE